MADTDLLALADRVERFDPSGPYDIARDKERELNEAIAAAAGIPATVEVGHEALGNYRKVPARLPAYTASLDAAATLVPKDYDWAVFHTNGGLTIHAWCGSREDVFGGSPALALCAAALRARAEIARLNGSEAAS